jgi:iron complex transport system substrate-binding protein
MSAARVLLLVAAAIFLAPETGYAGRRAAPEQRIVSLAPSVTETLFALGAGDQVVGVSRYCDYPPEVLKLPKVGTFLTPNVEAIAALRPTIVIGLLLSSERRQIRALNAMGIPTLLVSDQSLAEIEASIARIGERLGRRSDAARLLARMRARMRAVGERLADAPRVRTLMLVGHQPIVAVGRGTYLGEIIELARGDNIAARSAQAWPRLSVEYVIAMRPEVILDGQMGNDPVAPAGFWSKYSTIPAVRANRVHAYPQDPILHPGPRVWQSLEIIAARLHPRLMQDAGSEP